MEECTLEHKIKKQSELIRQQVNKFRRGFQAKQIKHNNFLPYLQAINYVFDLNNSYGQDYFQYISKKQLEFLLLNNRLLMKDICLKLKSLSSYLQKQKSQIKKQLCPGICKICSFNIQSRNIQQAKNNVEGVGINKLKKMLKKMEQQSNMALFTPDQDRNFFRQLNKVLIKKEEVLAITDNHLEKYLQDIMKNLQQIKYLQDMKDTTFSLPPSINWESKIKLQIHSVLLSSFKGKVPPWIQRMFDQFIKVYIKLTRQTKQSVCSQTDPYKQQQVFQLQKIIEDYKNQQKIDKTINQDYQKQLEEATNKMKNFQIQNTMLKDKLYERQISMIKNRASMMSNSKDSKSFRNSSLKPISQAQATLLNNNKKISKFKQTNSFLKQVNNNSVSLHEPQSIKRIVQQQNKQVNFGSQLRKQISVTQHIESGVISTHYKRRKNKKYTDIQSYKKLLNKSVQNSQTFLPSIKKIIKQNQPINNNKQPKQIKKISILSDYSLKVPKNTNNLDIPSLQRNQHSKSIVQVQQNKQNQISSQQFQQLSSEQREKRLKKYKQTVSDVQNHLQMKIQNIDKIKKMYDMKKRNSSNLSGYNTNSFSGYNLKNPIYLENHHINKKQMYSQTEIKQKIVKTVGQSTQTDSSQAQTNNNGILKSDKLKSKHTTFIQPNFNSIQVEVQTQKSHLELVKRFQKDQNLAQISDQHFERIMTKLLLHSNKKVASNQGINKKNLTTYSSIKNKLSQQNIQSKQIVDQTRRTLYNNKTSPQKANITHNNSQSNNIQTKRIAQIKTKTLLYNNSKSKQDNKQQNQQSPYKNVKQKSLSNQKNNHNQSSLTIRQSDDTIIKVNVFSKKDFSLFLNQQNSYKYETSLKKKYHKNPSSTLTEEQTKYFTSVYGVINMIKSQSIQTYHQILSFIKYPYQSVVNDFGILNIVKQMSLEAFLWYITRIKYYHKNCCNNTKKQQSKSICNHVQNFIEKVENLLVQTSYETVLCDNSEDSSIIIG